MPDDKYGEPPSPADVAALVSVLGLAIDRYIQNRARRTIAENAKADPARPKCRWVVESDACDFCKARGTFWVEPGEVPTESHSSCKCHLEAGCYKGTKRDYKQLSDSDINELQEQSNEVFAAFSDNQREAIGGYTLNDYTEVNRVLFNKLEGIPKEKIEKIRKQIDEIDSTFLVFHLHKDAIVYKGVPKEHYRDWKVGSIRPFEGFFSSSTDEAVAEKYLIKALRNTGSAIMIEVRIPKESRCLYIGANTSAAEGNEFELLLSRDTRFMVLEKSSERMILEVVAE